MVRQLLMAALGVALLVSALLLAQPRSVDVGSLTPALDPTTATGAPATDAPTHTPPAAPTTAPRPVPTPAPGARLADLSPTPVTQPVRLVGPDIDLDVPIVPVGIAADGQMQVPGDVGEAGWYRHGPTPGTPGNAVVAGHVDDRLQGLGAFHRLVELTPGDRLQVAMADGRTTSWEVTGRRELTKDEVPLDQLFRRDGPSQLVLVTCGGAFDDRARSYESNVVVVARPL